MTGDERFAPKIWAGLLALITVAVLLIAGALRDAPAQEAVDNARKPVEYAPVRKLTPDMATAFVQSEFPGHWTDSDRLIELFNVNCRLLADGLSYDNTVQGMVDGGASAIEAGYIVSMSVYSTCPDRG